ncbi:DNA mismatch repair endonuclease MutL [Aeromonas sp. BIGb0445]|uniref:DNA mismatch repair endonuclease MutL n=1 Tax=Aeromonas sp. BIGb0445 TaxID=2940593 RepID=UPI0021678359|nr:DNA mismatch repair endonuclease MutL [Aeromonas sp. BIGb0445]MCS3457885.1 DNA mismatch repair protein MutL [Aeromonas sp. BIGb0445]
MQIRILPPILANQIAAGEVVERPSSVVKELVENSLDAGANRIEIDIDKGGTKLIRIRDNGCGVPKDELVLALSRHATSKVATLDDLEGINSLGFRGEALASISSVSRLSFTSRTQEQSEAWQAEAEGREMNVTIRPAAHPVGTTVEVVDLFFNTPARRKFMRSEKTEFAHIDELVRRIALSRFDITLLLRHNDKLVRQYRAASSVQEQERRLAAVCGTPFMHHALAIESEHSDVRLRGWLATPAGARPQNDLQYTYVNGRMMRDKLINHAIRQAYDELLGPDRFAAYVLYIELDPRQVDVNVHPAKHEVRFHQARLIHDFIYQALFSALHQADRQEPLAMSEVSLPTTAPDYPGQAARTDWYGAEHGYRAPTEVREGARQGGSDGIMGSDRPASQPRTTLARGQSSHGGDLPQAPTREALRGMEALLTTLPALQAPPPTSTASRDEAHIEGTARALTLVEGRYLLLEQGGGLALLRLVVAERRLLRHWLLEGWGQGLAAQPLLLPVAFKLPKSLHGVAAEQEKLLKRMGLELKSGGRDTMILTRVPALLRQTDLARLLPELLQLLEGLSAASNEEQAQVLCQWLVEQGLASDKQYDFATATRLLGELVSQLGDPRGDKGLLRPLSLAAALAEFEEE